MYISAVHHSVFYFNDMQYFIPIICASVIRYETTAERQRGIEQAHNLKAAEKERAEKEDRLRRTSKERSQKETCRDTRTERQGYKEKRDGVLGLILGRSKDFEVPRNVKAPNSRP